MSLSVTKFANANAVITTGWTNPTNGYADDGVYATALPAKNSSVITDYGFPAFTTSDIPAGSTIVSVTAEIQDKSSTTSSTGSTITLQLKNGSTLLGSAQSQGMNLSDQLLTHQVTTGITQTDLQSANTVKAQVSGERTTSNTAITWSLDYVKLTVVYTPPAQTLSPSAAIATFVALAATLATGAVSVPTAHAASTWTATASTVSIASATPRPAITIIPRAPPTGHRGGLISIGLVIPEAPPVATTVAISTWTAIPPTLTLGGVTLSPAPAVGTWTARSSSVTPGASTRALGVGIATWQANAPTVTPGATSRATTVATSTWTAKAPTVTPGGSTRTTTVATSAWTALDGSVSTGGGSQTLHPTVATATWTAKDATPTAGATSVALGTSTASWTARNASISSSGGAQTLQPGHASFTWVVLPLHVTTTTTGTAWFWGPGLGGFMRR